MLGIIKSFKTNGSRIKEAEDQDAAARGLTSLQREILFLCRLQCRDSIPFGVLSQSAQRQIRSMTTGLPDLFGTLPIIVTEWDEGGRPYAVKAACSEEAKAAYYRMQDRTPMAAPN